MPDIKMEESSYLPNPVPTLTALFGMIKQAQVQDDKGNVTVANILHSKIDSYMAENLPLLIVELEKTGHHLETSLPDGRKFLICATERMANELFLKERIPSFCLKELRLLSCRDANFAALYDAKQIFAGKIVDNPPEEVFGKMEIKDAPRLHNKAALIGLARLRNDIARCSACPLHQTRFRSVPGEGHTAPGIVFVGEGPGQTEDDTGKPLVGSAGQELNIALAAAGIVREHHFLTNVVKCRPPENRQPKPSEMQACSHFLYEQIELLNPTVIVALGSTALGFFFPTKKLSITKIHGKLQKANVRGVERLIYPALHPAAALRQKQYKDMFTNDIMRLPMVLEGLKKGEVSCETDSTGEGV